MTQAFRPALAQALELATPLLPARQHRVGKLPEPTVRRAVTQIVTRVTGHTEEHRLEPWMLPWIDGPRPAMRPRISK